MLFVRPGATRVGYTGFLRGQERRARLEVRVRAHGRGARRGVTPRAEGCEEGRVCGESERARHSQAEAERAGDAEI